MISEIAVLKQKYLDDYDEAIEYKDHVLAQEALDKYDELVEAEKNE